MITRKQADNIIGMNAQTVNTDFSGDATQQLLEEIKAHAERGINWPGHSTFHIERIVQILKDAKVIE
jgi:hypothetical protein